MGLTYTDLCKHTQVDSRHVYLVRNAAVLTDRDFIVVPQYGIGLSDMNDSSSTAERNTGIMEHYALILVVQFVEPLMLGC